MTDVPPPALKALLHFLYTDDFDEVLKVLREEGSSEGSSSSGGASSSGASGAAEQSIAQLQAVLAAAHKYGVLRLLRWAEGQLCDKLSCEMACSLLSLAHVYGATELERNCLAFMKANMAQGERGPTQDGSQPARTHESHHTSAPFSRSCQARRLCGPRARGFRQVQHALRGRRPGGGGAGPQAQARRGVAGARDST